MSAAAVATRPVATLMLCATTALGLVLTPPEARAQEVIPKVQESCPIGYVDTFNGRCSTLGEARFTVTPSRGNGCPPGWIDIGGGYCRRR
jgi:hypothetical protein